jgi:hypothetical protein
MTSNHDALYCEIMYSINPLRNHYNRCSQCRSIDKTATGDLVYCGKCHETFDHIIPIFSQIIPIIIEKYFKNMIRSKTDIEYIMLQYTYNHSAPCNECSLVASGICEIHAQKQIQCMKKSKKILVDCINKIYNILTTHLL